MTKNISGANIKALRIQNALSQIQLAEKMCALGRPSTAKRIAAIEVGCAKVYDIDLVILCEILHTTIHDLLKDNATKPCGQ